MASVSAMTQTPSQDGSGQATAAAGEGSSLFFSHAFRPFFLAAGVYAPLALAAWLAWIGIHAAGAAPAFMSIAEPPHLWHAHEMIFGFGAAAAGGFLLTAIPSWTGAPHSRGLALAMMFALWLAGRATMWCTAVLPPGVAMLADLSFLPVLAFAAARQLAVKPTRRNAVFLSLVGIFALGNLVFHLGRFDLVEDGMTTGAHLGLGALVLMMVVIGGRVTPGFTTNALRRSGEFDRLPRSSDPVNVAAIGGTAATVACLVLGAPEVVTGLAAMVAAAANAIRLILWKGWLMRHDPIVWVLHAGYAWIVVGLVLLSLSLLGDVASPQAALHAWGTGAAGTMILAIMTRAALGHTGRPIVAAPAIVIAYGLVSVAALLRCFGPWLLPEFYNEIMLMAGIAWIAAFVLFTVVYAPILTGPRVMGAGT